MIGPAAPASATPPIKAVWSAVDARWGDRVVSWGVFVCKHVRHDPDEPWSEHSWGNAWDIRPVTSSGSINMALGDAINAFLNSAAERPVVAYTLWRVADHYDHLHVAGRPLRNPGYDQVPPCAGGAVQQYPGGRVTSPQPLPTPGAMVASESWAAGSRTVARELQVIAHKVSRGADAARRLASEV